ncbi:MAG TPA: MBL fold metallo-hydrolase [Acidobacteriaceae bacterium]|nr:MBL fold metallo-hydrolase [Acidobacteriaceae bacterium]
MSLRRVPPAFGTGACVALVISALALCVRAQTPDRSAPAGPVWNNNSLIALQKKGGDPARPGDVAIDFYGHDAFKFTSPEGLTILVDPWRNDPAGLYPKWFLHNFPPLRVDIVLSTHAHFDHDAVSVPHGLMVLDRLAGRFRLGDVEITGLADKHQCASTPSAVSNPSSANSQTCPSVDAAGQDNAIQIIATGGLRIAIWGDNRTLPDAFVDPYLKGIDVLILPVDNVLPRPEADAVIRKYDPMAIIPAHYSIQGLSTQASGLESADAWVADQENAHHAEVRRLPTAHLTLNPVDLKGAHHRIYYFGDHFKKD